LKSGLQRYAAIGYRQNVFENKVIFFFFVARHLSNCSQFHFRHIRRNNQTAGCLRSLRGDKKMQEETRATVDEKLSCYIDAPTPPTLPYSFSI
jgi:hypothetical protein